MGFAVLNVVFSFYLCYKVWSQIMTRKDDFVDGDQPVEAQRGRMAGLGNMAKKASGAAAEEEAEVPLVAPREGFLIVPQDIVVESFGHVWMNDLFVLFMFFALIALALLAWFGQGMVDPKAEDSKIEICSVSGSTVDCGYFFLSLAAVWSLAWMKCNCCSREVYLKKDIQDALQEAGME